MRSVDLADKDMNSLIDAAVDGVCLGSNVLAIPEVWEIARRVLSRADFRVRDAVLAFDRLGDKLQDLTEVQRLSIGMR